MISAALTYPSGESGYTLLVDMARPDEVRLDGDTLDERDDRTSGDGPGWQYLPGRAMCLVRIAEDGEHSLELRGVEYRRADIMPQPRDDLTFTFDESTEGWMADHDIRDLRVDDGVLKVDIAGIDPYMSRSMLNVNGDSVDEVVIRMGTSAGSAGQFYWATSGNPAMSEDRVVLFPVTADGEWHEYRIPVAEHAQWRGETITAVRLDPLSPGEDVTVEIDSIRGE